MTVHGKIAKQILKYLLDNFEGEGNYTPFPISGYFKEGDHFICFDNESYCCFVEQARTKKKAKRWRARKIDTPDLYW